MASAGTASRSAAARAPLPLHAAYRQFAGVASLLASARSDAADEVIDGLLAGLEERLANGRAETVEDLLAQLHYLRDCARIDGGLVTVEAVGAVIEGFERICLPARAA